MTKRARRPIAQPPIVVQIGLLSEAQLDACARALARIAVEKALGFLALDRSDQLCDHVGNQHKAAPPGGETPNGAKEQVT